MNNLPSASTEVFQIIRSYDYAVKMWDGAGTEVYTPEDARRFYASPENLLIAVVDDNENSRIEMTIGQSTPIEKVFGLSQALRSAATKYNMVFKVEQANRKLKPQDFGVVTEGTQMHQLTEGMYGTSRSSYLRLENARLIVRHTTKIDENVRGSRARHINSIFVENAQGERFLLNTTQLAPARAMASHVNFGGDVSDEVGYQIARIADAYRSLGACSAFVRSNAVSLDESAHNVREQCRSKIIEMRSSFARLARPTSYEAEAAEIQNQQVPLAEDSVVEALRRTLTVEGREIAEQVLNTVASYVDVPHLSEAIEPTMISVLGGQRVSEDAWNDLCRGEIKLGAPTSDDASVPKFASKEAEALFEFNKVVERVQDDSLQNLLSWVGDKLVGGDASPQLAANLGRVMRAVLKAARVDLDHGIVASSKAVNEYIEWFEKSNPNVMFESDDCRDSDYSYETDHMGGIKLIRNCDGASRYFQPGDDAEEFEHRLAMCDDDVNCLAPDYFDGIEEEFLEEDEDSVPVEPQNANHSPAWQEGYQAAHSGSTPSCPYPAQSQQASDWAQGLAAGESTADQVQVREEIALRREDILIPTNKAKSLKNEVTRHGKNDPHAEEEVTKEDPDMKQLMKNAGR